MKQRLRGTTAAAADTPRPLRGRFRRRRGWLQMNASVLFRRTDNGGDEGREGGGAIRLRGSRWNDSARSGAGGGRPVHQSAFDLRVSSASEGAVQCLLICH